MSVQLETLLRIIEEKDLPAAAATIYIAKVHAVTTSCFAIMYQMPIARLNSNGTATMAVSL